MASGKPPSASPRAAQRIRNCSAPAQRLERGHQRVVAPFLRGDHQIGQRLPREARLFTLVERAEARRQVGLQRKGGQQLLAEAVDRLDAQATAGRFQHFGEQPPRLILHVGIMAFAQRDEVSGQRWSIQLHPGGEAIVDAVRHFRGARLGEGEAQNIFRPHPLKQQAEHARGQHMRLARAGGGGQPDMRIRRGGPRLIAEQLLKCARLSHRRGHTIPPAASAGHNRHNWRLPG
jgi:hypothetical protein